MDNSYSSILDRFNLVCKFSRLFNQFVTRTVRKGEQILATCTSCDVFPRKDVPFGGLVDSLRLPIYGVKSYDYSRPKIGILGAWKGIFKPNSKNYWNYCTDSKQVLENDKDHQTLWMVRTRA